MQEIIIHEVGLRDGLQMEKQIVATEQKIKWIEELMRSGVDIIQIGSFVHPTRVPQMADTDEISQHFQKTQIHPNNVIFSALVLNEKGVERAFASNVGMICMGVSASDTHSRKNTGMHTGEAIDRMLIMAKSVMDAKRKLQVSVQSAFGCGYEGYIPKERVIQIVQRFIEAGITTISLADTAGHATPDLVERLYEAIFSLDDAVDAACHFHNTYGLALANSFAAMKAGVKYFESSFAGLGGCPFTAIAGGNTCTEDMVHLIQRMGFRTEIQLDTLIGVAKDASFYFDREMTGMIYRTGPIPSFAQKQVH